MSGLHSLLLKHIVDRVHWRASVGRRLLDLRFIEEAIGVTLIIIEVSQQRLVLLAGVDSGLNLLLRQLLEALRLLVVDSNGRDASDQREHAKEPKRPESDWPLIKIGRAHV